MRWRAAAEGETRAAQESERKRWRRDDGEERDGSSRNSEDRSGGGIRMRTKAVVLSGLRRCILGRGSAHSHFLTDVKRQTCQLKA